ncbi:hypothetical protein SpCBS45565_g05410 [Spizellomyces sp. 'palustris']|nr:hypothetical protein SpCBS45565_g05410 [Spizellomyces sp. 'palustris']
MPASTWTRLWDKRSIDFGLHAACSAGDIGWVKFALDNGQSVNAVFHGMTPLHVSSGQGDIGVIRLLIQRGAYVNGPRLSKTRSADNLNDLYHQPEGSSLTIRGQTALHFAAANGHLEVVRELLVHGACPTIRDEFNCSPIDVAAAVGRRDIVDVLLRTAQVWDTKERDVDRQSVHSRKSKRISLWGARRNSFLDRPYRFSLKPIIPSGRVVPVAAS